MNGGVEYITLVEAAQHVAATSKRSEKTALIAALLRQVAPAEVRAVIGLLVGEPRQGRMGVGWARLRDARAAAAAAP